MCDDKGHVFTFGRNDYGQLGADVNKDGNSNNLYSHEPILVQFGDCSPSSPVIIADVACGRGHTLVRDNQGRCYSWGASKRGQLGIDFFNEDKHLHHHSRNPEFISKPHRIPKLCWATEIACGFDSSGTLL